jgi:hypothetical protein
VKGALVTGRRGDGDAVVEVAVELKRLDQRRGGRPCLLLL